MATKQIKWKTEKRLLRDLKPMPNNPRKASEKEAFDLDKSLERFSLAVPLVINTDNQIIGGHFRYNRLVEKFGENHKVEVRVPDRKLSRKLVEELNLRLNKNVGRFDFDVLANFNDDLLKDVGFTPAELSMVFGLNEMANPLEKSTIQGETKDEGEYMILIFADKKESAPIRKRLGMNESQRTILFSEFKEKWNGG